MITSLSTEQMARMAEYRDRWTAIGLSTEPADRGRAERAICSIYSSAKLPLPAKIVWCGSPLSQGLTRAIIFDKSSVRDSVGASVGDSGYGQHDAAWLASYAYFREVVGLREQTEKLLDHIELAQSAGWYLPYTSICLVSERHSLLERDGRGRLHSLTGPAVAYPDGWQIYSVHGVRVPADIIETRDSITPERIEKETNAEVRRVLIELFGFDRYLHQGNFRLEQHDDFGRLYRKKVQGEPDMVFVRVVNSTPEPDGSFKEYVLPCRSGVKTAHEAVAASFGLDVKTYNPFQES